MHLYYSVFKIHLNTDIFDKKTLLNVREYLIDISIVIGKCFTVVSIEAYL